MSYRNDTYIGLATNLKKLINFFDISVSDLHRATGVPITTIFRLVSGECANPTIASVIPLAEYFKIPLLQLIGIEVLNLENKQINVEKNNYQVPVISWNDVNVWLTDTPILLDKFIDTNLRLSKKAFALTVDIDDMQSFPKNSILIIEPDKEPFHNNFVISYKKGLARASLKQYLIEEGNIYLRPLNNHIPSQLIDENTLICGIVLQVIFNQAQQI